jgi:hypothetical protein
VQWFGDGVRIPGAADFKSQFQLREVSMKDRWISRILMVVAPAMIVCVVLGSRTPAVGQSDEVGEVSGHCSNRTLFGDYGGQIEGTILGPNLPLRTLIKADFDGEGNLTDVDHVVLNGVPPAQEWRPGSGTYTVNPDCTGSALFNTGNAPIPVHFVVVNKGKEIRGVVDGNAITVIASKVD